jgi:putative superfamily III holin-X
MRYDPRYDGDRLADRPLGDLLGEMARDGQELLREELRLAKAELRAEAKKAARGGAELGAGGAVLYAALLLFGATLVLIGATFLPAWLSALIVTVIYGAAGAIAIGRGKQDLAKASPARVVGNLKEDERWAKETMHDIKSSRGASASAH